MKYMKTVRERFKSPKFPVFKAQELKTLGIGSKYLKRLIHLLLSRGEITRITRGILHVS